MAATSKNGVARKDDPARLRPPRSQGRSSGRSALAHLPKHLQAAIVSYRRQADVSGDLDPAVRQFLDHIGEKETRESVMAKIAQPHSERTPFIEESGVFANCHSEKGACVVLVRPDSMVFGTATDVREAERFLRELRSHLAG